MLGLLQSKEALFSILAILITGGLIFSSYKWGQRSAQKKDAEAVKKAIESDLKVVKITQKKVEDMTEKELDDHL